tara:strand:- start:415 stop:1131 length:717 start_codon:yes stop_codon:yes gene_type:complete
MNLNDLYKLAGIPRDDTPAIEPQPVEQVAEQPMDGREDMKAMIALVTPEQLNQIVGNAPVEEEGFANSGDEYAGEPEEYNGTLGSPADLSLRRYLGANGVPVNVDETKVYEDHKVEDITEAWQAYKADPVVEVKTELEEEPNEGNEFSGELAKAKAAGKKEFKVGDKTYKVESEETDEEAVTEETDDELEEGKLPPGLQAYQDKKKKESGDKDEDDDDDEEAVEESEELSILKRNAGI